MGVEDGQLGREEGPALLEAQGDRLLIGLQHHHLGRQHLLLHEKAQPLQFRLLLGQTEHLAGRRMQEVVGIGEAEHGDLFADEESLVLQEHAAFKTLRLRGQAGSRPD